jgi:acyl dehydratase
MRTGDDLQPGQHFRHEPGRTITEFDDTFFSLMSMNQHPLHIDAHYASSTQHAQRLVVGPLVVSIVVGLAQSALGRHFSRALEYESVRHTAPVLHGDTIYAESTVLEAAPDGTVLVESRGLNQRGEVVLTMKRRFLTKRPAAS